MHKGLIAGAAVFSMFSAYSLQAATVERVSPSNKPQLQNLLLMNQTLQKSQIKGSYFEEITSTHQHSNSVLRKSSSNKILQHLRSNEWLKVEMPSQIYSCCDCKKYSTFGLRPQWKHISCLKYTSSQIDVAVSLLFVLNIDLNGVKT